MGLSNASGLNRRINVIAESSFGVAPTNSASAFILNRKDISIDNKLNPITSEIKKENRQKDSPTRGTEDVAISVNSELANTKDKDFFESLLSSTFGSIADISLGLTTQAVSGSAPMQVVLTSASAPTGIKVGDVFKITGVVGNNGINLVCIGVDTVGKTITAIPLKIDETLVAVGTSVATTIAISGKQINIPSSGFVSKSLTFEDFNGDVPAGDVYVGNKVKSFKLSIAGINQKISTSFDLVGIKQDVTVSHKNATPRYSSAVENKNLTFGSGHGVLVIPKATLADNSVVGPLIIPVTSYDLTVERSLEPSKNILNSSGVSTSIAEGTYSVSGSISAYFKDKNIHEIARNFKTIPLVLSLQLEYVKDSAFLSFSMPNVNLEIPQKDDPEGDITLTIPFTASQVGTLSTIYIQDSALV